MGRQLAEPGVFPGADASRRGEIRHSRHWAHSAWSAGRPSVHCCAGCRVRRFAGAGAPESWRTPAHGRKRIVSADVSDQLGPRSTERLQWCASLGPQQQTCSSTPHSRRNPWIVIKVRSGSWATSPVTWLIELLLVAELRAMPAADDMEALSAAPRYRVISMDLAAGPGVSVAIPAEMKPAIRRTSSLGFIRGLMRSC